MKKINWKSFLPLVFAIFAPQLSVLSAKTGVAVSPAMISGMSLGMVFLSISDILPLIQPIFLIIGGLTANGVKKGIADWSTNITGFLGSLFGVLAGIGIVFSPSLKENIISFSALLIGVLSRLPEEEAVN